jgi:hypothetical protein
MVVKYPELLKKIHEQEAGEAAKFAAKEAAEKSSSIQTQPQSIPAH